MSETKTLRDFVPSSLFNWSPTDDEYNEHFGVDVETYDYHDIDCPNNQCDGSGIVEMEVDEYGYEEAIVFCPCMFPKGGE